MNIRPSEPTLVVHFSAAKVDHVDEIDGVLVGYDGDGHIVDVSVRTRNPLARLDFVEQGRDAFPANVTYDSEADAINIGLDSSPYADSDEILPDFIVDRDVDGFIRSLEFLNVSHLFSAETMFGVRKHATLL